MKMTITTQATLDEFVRRIKTFPLKHTYLASFVRSRNIRTLNQNRLYWLYIQCVSRETGNTPDDLHEYFTNKFLGERTNVKVFDTTIVSRPTTTTLDTAQFTTYLDNIKADMLEYGIFLPNPEEHGFEAFVNEYETRQ